MPQFIARVEKKSSTKKPLADVAYEAIYRKIISLEFEPGHLLDEKNLMIQLGLGRTPIREALLRLSSDMMVESRPSKGFIVRPITLQSTKAVFEALKIMELGVVELALKNDIRSFLPAMKSAAEAVKSSIAERNILGLVESNYEFHMHFYRASQNIYLVSGLYQVRLETKRLAFLSYSNEIDPIESLRDHYSSVLEEHNEILTYLEEKEAEKLGEVISRHIEAFRKRIIIYLTS